MKKIKIMLTVMAVLAIVGGALAFRVRTTNVFCGKQGAIAGQSDCPLKIKTTFTPVLNCTVFCTNKLGTPCNIQACTGSNAY